MKLVGIDIGTTSVCLVVMDARTGGICASASQANTASVPGREPWESVQDPDRIVEVVTGLLEAHVGAGEPSAAGQPGPEAVAGIGISSQMHGILYVDPAGRAISPLFTWQDGRGNLPYDGTRTYAEALSGFLGRRVPSGYGLVTHWYHVVNRLVPEQAAKLVTIGDYVAMKLTGRRYPVIDPSHASGIGGRWDPACRLTRNGDSNRPMASGGAQRLNRGIVWDESALGAAGIDIRILPEPVPFGTRVGETPDGAPVFSAIGDNQASFLGAVSALRNNDPQKADGALSDTACAGKSRGSVSRLESSLLLNVGTGMQVCLLAEQPVQHPDWECRPFPGDRYLLVAASLGGGRTYALLERFFRRTLSLFGASTENEPGHGEAREQAYGSGRDLFERMNEVAQAYLRREGMDQCPSVEPYFYGMRSRPELLGSITRLCESNFTPEHLLIGWLHGIATELHRYYEELPAALRSRVCRLVGAGNGIRRNEALRTVLEWRFGMPVEVTPFPEEAAVGAAVYAGMATGLLPGV